MKRLSGLSFRNKLLLAFLLIGVVPLLIFTVLMLNIFRVTLAGNARDAAEAELSRRGAGPWTRCSRAARRCSARSRTTSSSARS